MILQFKEEDWAAGKIMDSPEITQGISIDKEEI